jgi:hypothetical protein
MKRLKSKRALTHLILGVLTIPSILVVPISISSCNNGDNEDIVDAKQS